MKNIIHKIHSSFNRNKRIYQHIAFWLSYYGLYISYCFLTYESSLISLLRDNLFYVSVDIIITYSIILVSDFSLKKKQYFILAFLASAFLAVGVIMYRAAYVYLISPLFYDSNSKAFWDFNLLHYIYSLFFPVALINIIHLIRKWVHSQVEIYEIAKAKINHELSFLKIQLNQHFLFNTLNNIDSLIYSDPESASQTIVNLSNLLRYSIYETDVQKVPVKKEINYIRTFIELYALRIIDANKIELKISGNYEDLYIVPRLFIPFVENALIYGRKDDDSKIYISITFVEKKVILHTMNQTKKIDYKRQGGVGIANVRRTLDLVYPNNYKLDMKEKDNWYTLKLTINIDNERNNDMYNC